MTEASPDLVRAQALNNAWANHRLHRSCALLDAAALIAPRKAAFFGSIIATLNHIVIVDRFYVSGMEDAPLGPAAYADVMPYPDLPSLTEAQVDIDRRLIAVTEDPALREPAREIVLPREDAVQIERFDRLFLHLNQHQIHHRGQVHALLTEAGAGPPQLDEFHCAWPQDRDRRAPDLAEMGLTEADVWPPDA